jgi:prevent-host-death family protein
MTATTLKDARERFDELIRRARRGETVIIRQRGKPAVQLVPVTSKADLELGVDEVHKLDAWADKERDAGHTRAFESAATYVAQRRAHRTLKSKSR